VISEQQLGRLNRGGTMIERNFLGELVSTEI
jgi:hypothetical protein